MPPSSPPSNSVDAQLSQLSPQSVRELLLAGRNADMVRLRLYRRVLAALPPEQQHLRRELQDAIMQCIRVCESITGVRAWDGV